MIKSTTNHNSNNRNDQPSANNTNNTTVLWSRNADSETVPPLLAEVFAVEPHKSVGVKQ